jgi:hypothetical protein
VTVLVLSLVALLAVAWQLADLLRGLPRLRQLRQVEALPADRLPTLSVVVSALDEAGTIEPALASLLALDYPRLEVIAIDDRSTDGTGAVLERVAARDPRLRVLRVEALPSGWLGKTHALHLGAQHARGELLLFTDADVLFERAALRRAASHSLREGIDHLVVLAELPVRGHLLAALLLDFHAFFFAAQPPWRLDTSRRVSVGMGAFNLVRAEAYRAIGGHEALRLDVLDDLMLGKRLKRAGFRQALLLGRGAVSVEWYPGTGALARGLEKNSFAAVGYSVPALLAATAAVLLLRVWPVCGLLFASGPARWINLAGVLLGLAIHLRVIRLTPWSRRALWWWPLSPLVMLAVLLRGACLTLWRRGVLWRGTLYPLEELRRWHRR